MAIEFDPPKDAINVAEHGVSLARAAELDIVAVVRDVRYAEARWRAYGFLDGFRTASLSQCATGGCAPSASGAHLKEFRRHASPDQG